MNLQAVYQVGKTFLYIPLVALDELLYNEGDDVLLKFYKKDCRYFVLSATTELCADRVKIIFDSTRCFEQLGRWDVDILTYTEVVEEREKIGQLEVIVYEHKQY